MLLLLPVVCAALFLSFSKAAGLAGIGASLVTVAGIAHRMGRRPRAAGPSAPTLTLWQGEDFRALVRSPAVRKFLLAALFLATAGWPLVVFSDPAVQDYPNHLARAFILLHRDDPFLARLYAVRWSPLPDLGWDLWAITLGRFLSLAVLGPLFLILYLLLGLGGLFALNGVAAARASLLPLLGVPLLFNGGFTNGFLSFDLGVAVVLWAIASWLYLPERRWLLRLVIATVFSTLLYFIHFYAWAMYGVFLFGLEVPRLWRERWGFARLSRDGLQAVPPLLLLFYLSRHLPEAVAATGYFAFGRRFQGALLLIDTNHIWLDLLLLAGLSGAIAYAMARGHLRFGRRAALPLLLCLLLYLVIPDTIFGTQSVPWRILLGAALVFVASLSPGPGIRPTRLLVAGAWICTLAASIALGWSASAQAREKRDFLAAIAPMRNGATLFWAHSGEGQHALLSHDGVFHLGAFAVPAKRALVQSMFVYPGQQVLEFRDPAFASPRNSDTILPVIARNFRAAHKDLRAYARRFDYILLQGPGSPADEAILPLGVLLKRQADCRLYAVKK